MILTPPRWIQRLNPQVALRCAEVAVLGIALDTLLFGRLPFVVRTTQIAGFPHNLPLSPPHWLHKCLVKDP